MSFPTPFRRLARPGALTAAALVASATAATLVLPSVAHATPVTRTATAVGASRTVSAAGAGAVGSTRYAVPGNALYVSPRGSDSSGSGSLGAPFASLGRALAASSNGSTIVLRGGSYNESVFVGKSVTIEGYPGEQAWLDGSIPVTSWARSGGDWVHTGWNYRFDHSASTEQGSNAGGYVNAAHPLAAWPDQVFRNGAQLTQVAGNPGPGQFAVDYSRHTLTVGSDPSGAAMRASNVGQAMVVSAGHVTLRGFGVRNYATSLPMMGTVYLGGSEGGDLVSHLTVTNNGGQGISVYSPHVRIENTTSSYNGMTGIHATKSNALTITGCDIFGNNTQHFNGGPAAGGMKVGVLDGLTVTNNHVHDNYGITGIWTDMNTRHFTIANNVVDVSGHGGSEYGILTELSDTGVVAGNRVSGAKYGYTAFDTGHVQVFNNTMWNNSVWDIGLSQDDRYQPGHNAPGVFPMATCPWVVNYVAVANNDLSRSRAMYEFYALDKATRRPADAMHITLQGNLFTERHGSSGPWPIGWGNGNIWSPTNYPSVRAWEVAHKLASLNLTTSGAARSVSAVPSTRTLVAVPAPVAAALGVAAGTRSLGAF